jgi:hypothetical protein
MTTSYVWQELYRAALLEVRPEQLRPRIDAAEAAIQQRLAELRQGDSSCEDERHALVDALAGLRILVNTECTPRVPSFVLVQQREPGS